MCQVCTVAALCQQGKNYACRFRASAEQMELLSFCAASTLLVACHLSALGLLFLWLNWAVGCEKLGLLTVFVVLLLRVVSMLRRVAALTKSDAYLLPESGPTLRIDKFVLPLLELAAIWGLTCAAPKYVPSESLTAAYYTIGAVVAADKLCIGLWMFCPIDYNERFARFLKTFEIWSNCNPESMIIADAQVRKSISEEDKPTFNLDSFRLSKTKLMPILGSMETPFYDGNYSVSPKNTLHSNFDPSQYSDYEEPERNSDSEAESSETELEEVVCEFKDFERKESIEAVGKRHSFIGAVKWFRWLLPLELPPKVESHAQLIRRKLSTFTMNSELCVKSPLYGTFDFELQKRVLETLNVHTFYCFARFANHSFDVWLNKNVISSVDPVFRRFGVVLPKFECRWFLLLLVTLFLWNVGLVLLILQKRFVLVVIGRLFTVNYLGEQCRSSYKVLIFANYLVSVCIFALLIYSFV